MRQWPALLFTCSLVLAGCVPTITNKYFATLLDGRDQESLDTQ